MRRRRWNKHVFILAIAVFLILELIISTSLFIYFPRVTRHAQEQNGIIAALTAQKLEAFLSSAAGIKTVEQNWRTNCDVAATAVLEAEPTDIAAGIFLGSSPICLHIRLDTPKVNQNAEPAVLNPESLAELRRIVQGGVHIALTTPPEWPGLVAVAIPLDSEGDQTSLLIRVVPVSVLTEKLTFYTSRFGQHVGLTDNKGSLLAGALDDDQEPEARRKFQAALKNPLHPTAIDAQTEVIAAKIGQTNASLICLTPLANTGLTPLIWTLLSITTLLLGVGVALAAFIINRVVFVRLMMLKRIARAYSQGRYSVRFRRSSYMPQEILTLGMALNEMADSSARQAEELQSAAAEETRLLLELHHRVKNNFQVVESLLSLLKKGNPTGQVAHLRFVEEHVRAMAVADRAAYGAHGMRVAIDELISGVIDGLRITAGLSGTQVRLELGVPLGTLNLDRAVALCLCLAVAVPPYLVAATSTKNSMRVLAELTDAGLLHLIITGPVPVMELSPFLRERLIQAYLKQLEAVPGSGWGSGYENGFSILIPGVQQLKAA